MYKSHLGRNGTMFDSYQTEKQRALFEARFTTGRGVDKEITKKIFSGSPEFGDLASFEQGVSAVDRGSFFNTTVSGNTVADNRQREQMLRHHYAINRETDVTGGFGFDSTEIVSMSYDTKPDFSNEGHAIPQALISDLFDSVNADSLVGHPNLKVNKFSTQSGDTSLQKAANDTLPGSNVDASSSRLDTIGQYFKGAGQRP